MVTWLWLGQWSFLPPRLQWLVHKWCVTWARAVGLNSGDDGKEESFAFRNIVRKDIKHAVEHRGRVMLSCNDISWVPDPASGSGCFTECLVWARHNRGIWGPLLYGTDESCSHWLHISMIWANKFPVWVQSFCHFCSLLIQKAQDFIS